MTCSATLFFLQPQFEQLRLETFDLGISEYFDGCGLGSWNSDADLPGVFHQIDLENIALVSSSMLTETLAEAIGLSPVWSYVPGLRF